MIDLSHIIPFPFPKLQRACTGKQRTQYRQPDTRRSPPSPSNTLDRFNKPFTAKNNWQLFDRPLKTRRRSERENVVEVLLYHDNSEGTMSFGVKRQGLDYTVTKTFEASNKPEHTSAEKNQIRLKFSTYLSRLLTYFIFHCYDFLDEIGKFFVSRLGEVQTWANACKSMFKSPITHFFQTVYFFLFSFVLFMV